MRRSCHCRTDIRTNANHTPSRPTRGPNRGQRRARVARRAHKHHAVLVHQLLSKLHKSAIVGRGGGFAVAHVDDAGLVLQDGDDGPSETDARLLKACV